EGDRVGAGPQVGDLVVALFVGDRGADFLDQRRTGRLNGDAGQHGAGGIPGHAGNRARRGGLRPRRYWKEPHADTRHETCDTSLHHYPPRDKTHAKTANPTEMARAEYSRRGMPASLMSRRTTTRYSVGAGPRARPYTLGIPL